MCIGGIFFGAHLAWTSPVLPQLEESSPLHTATFTITTEESSWIGAIFPLGGIVASIPAGYLAKRYGCKCCIIGMSIPCLIFSVMVLLAQDPYTLIAGRLLTGIATAGTTVVGPIYISEISSVSIRGTLGSFYEFVIYIGISFTSIAGAYMNYRILTVLLGAAGMVLTIGFWFLPDMPSDLLKRNDRAGAERALAFYRNTGYDVTKELDTIQKEMIKRTESNLRFVDIVRSKASVRSIVAAVGIATVQQICGINAIIFYGVHIFQITGSSIDAYTCSVIIASIQLICAFITIFIMELAGRKTYLYISIIGWSVGIFGIAVYFHLQLRGITFGGIDALPLLSMAVGIITFSVGLGPIPWMLRGELFPIEIKGPASGLVTTIVCLLMFIVTKTFPTLLESIGPAATFYMFSGMTALFVVFTKLYVPETKGKSLQEIQYELSK